MPMVNFSEEEIETVVPYLYGVSPWDEGSHPDNDVAVSFRAKLEGARSTTDTDRSGGEQT